MHTALSEEDKAMINNPDLCPMWLATYATPEHFDDMSHLLLSKCALSMAGTLDTNPGVQESDTREGIKIKCLRFLKENLEAMQDVFRERGIGDREMDHA